jgi:hypothetical protein
LNRRNVISVCVLLLIGDVFIEDEPPVLARFRVVGPVYDPLIVECKIFPLDEFV